MKKIIQFDEMSFKKSIKKSKLLLESINRKISIEEKNGKEHIVINEIETRTLEALRSIAKMN